MRRDILEALCRHGPLSFTEIMRVTGYSKGSVSIKLRRLIEDGLVSRIGRYYYVNRHEACQGSGLLLVIRDRGREYTITLDGFVTALEAVLRLTSPREKQADAERHVEAAWEGINRIAAFVKNGAVITTDEDGRLDASIPSGLRKELEEAVWTVAWAIETLLTRKYVSDAYIVPVYYTIRFVAGKLVIHHMVEWSNA